MKRLLFILLLTAPAHGQVRDARIEGAGAQVRVSFEAAAPRRNEQTTLTPILYDGLGNSQALEPLTVGGRGTRRKPQRYEKTTLRLPWMDYVALAVQVRTERCCTVQTTVQEQIAPPALLSFTLTPHFSAIPLRYELTELEQYDIENPFLHPAEDYHKRHDILNNDREKGTASVVFKVASATLDTSMEANGRVLESIVKAFDLIERDPNARLKQIMVAGYASPEGALALNERLGRQRAEAVKRYVQARMSQPHDELFELHNGGEDWAGLRQMAQRAGMMDVVQTIDHDPNRKETLKRHPEYPRMLDEFYTKLRTGGYVQVYYEIDRRATVATAVTDEWGRTTWVDPDSPRNRAVTAINKGIEKLVDGDFDAAMQSLEPHADDPRAWNAIGVCHMMRGDYDRADEYFHRATDDPNALLNLEQTRWARKTKNYQ